MIKKERSICEQNSFFYCTIFYYTHNCDCFLFDVDQAQEDMEANQQDQEEVEAQIEDAHGGQSPPQRITRSMFKALGARGHLFSLFVISLVEGA